MTEPRLPTLTNIKATIPDSIDSAASDIALGWFTIFSSHLVKENVEGLIDHMSTDALWRDVLALTWDIRTFDGPEKIRQFLHDRLALMKIKNIKWKDFVRFQQPTPDVAWILVVFDFETEVGMCAGVARLIPTAGSTWKAYTICTTLEELKDYPEKISGLRVPKPISGVVWANQRRKEADFAESASPSVLIIGGGQSGLILAARLKYIGVSALVIEKDDRLGDSWRRRYDSLCLHFPVWFDNMPYIPFPNTWPKYTPGLKMADWLESYARILELNVWTSSTVTGAKQGMNGTWLVEVTRPNGEHRTFDVNHLVFATGQGDGVPRMPNIPNAGIFKGKIIHSSKYKEAGSFISKKVIIIGTGNSAHDVATDLANNGVDVTIYQRSPTLVLDLDRGWKYLGAALYDEGSPPNHISDRLTHSIPHLVQERGLAQFSTNAVLEDQKDSLDLLRKVGFKLTSGILGAGLLLNLKQKGGGHYFDTGGSQLIIDGKIKLKNDSGIKAYGENSLIFEDGSRVEADAVICATGCGDVRKFIRQICGDTVADACPPLLGVNVEGEMSWFRPLIPKGLWYMHGNFSLNRYYSKHVAMQIKAMDEGLVGSRYTSDIGPDCVQLRA